MRMTTSGFALSMLLLITSAVSGNNSAPAPDAASCEACHKGALDLGNLSTEDLVAVLSAMTSSNRPHPTDLTALDDKSIRELAAALTR